MIAIHASIWAIGQKEAGFGAGRHLRAVGAAIAAVLAVAGGGADWGGGAGGSRRSVAVCGQGAQIVLRRSDL